ncbi:MAG: glucose-1-phosphate adenylyltransferase family protein, partial [Dehalococcoidia bacterium]
MKNVLAMILAGGQGDRLSILSEERAKPAVIFGGKYRIIDFVLSNCANSNITRVGVLTQYRPRSLNDHIGSGRPWDLDREGGGVFLLQPYLGREISDWYRGTADAVYQNLFFVEESMAEEVLILAGDHIYAMTYDAMLDFHRESRADVTVPVYDVPIGEAHRFGILEMDESGRVTRFWEKPENPPATLASTGIYLFNKDMLVDRLQADAARVSSHDFGRDILPEMIGEYRVFGYPLTSYWRDVGTVEAYWQSNMDLLVELPELNLYDPNTVVRTRESRYPPAKIGPTAHVSRSLLNAGDIINGTVEHSVIAPGVYVEAGAVVRDSIIFDGCVIARGAVVERAILDKEVYVGENAVVGPSGDFTPNDERPELLNSGISIVGKRARLPAGIQIGRNCVIGPAIRVDEFAGLTVPSG